MAAEQVVALRISERQRSSTSTHIPKESVLKAHRALKRLSQGKVARLQPLALDTQAQSQAAVQQGFPALGIPAEKHVARQLQPRAAQRPLRQGLFSVAISRGPSSASGFQVGLNAAQRLFCGVFLLSAPAARSLQLCFLCMVQLES